MNTQTQTQYAADLIAEASADGYAVIAEGVYLQTADYCMDEADSEEGTYAGETFDFRDAPYWILSDDGVVVPILDVADLERELNWPHWED